VLIYNPAAGRNRLRRLAQVRQVAVALSALEHSVELIATSAPGSATQHAQDAARGGADIVFACGGDGTIHEVLQGLASKTGKPTAALGIIPLGSANALARHLRLSLDPVKAALQQLQGAPLTIPVGQLTYCDQVRYFAVMAGAGPDGALAYSLLPAQKSSLGRLAYYVHAAGLFTSLRFGPFEVEYIEAESGVTTTLRAVSAIAVRVNDLGGLFSGLTGRRASIRDAHLRLILVRPPAALSLPLWFVTGWLNLTRFNPLLHTVNVTEFTCRPIAVPAPNFQADGEWLGHIPFKVSILPNALRILLPATH
jgi:YegS/Rv2252/BmrU family lipid kinase